jgi:anti-sigma factor RsiW
VSVCTRIRNQFSEYLDGALTGVAMQQVDMHLRSCKACAADFAQWQSVQETLGALGPAKAPPDLALRLRVALSQERTRTPKQSLARWQVRWQNNVAPFLLQASAGVASAVLLVGTVALLVSTFAAPEPAVARDEPIGRASSPRFLYSSAATNPDAIGDHGNPVVVYALVNGSGRVYDYQIVSGPQDARTRSQLEELLLFSVFEPARVFGQPVRGLAILSFAGVSVQG